MRKSAIGTDRNRTGNTRELRELASVDAQSLRLFLAVHDAGSVTEAARHLGISQSSASAGLDKLRRIFKDRLFVKSGRGIVPTDRVHALVPRVVTVLSQLESLLEIESFDPSSDLKSITIAINGHERITIAKAIFAVLGTRSVRVNFMDISARNNLEDVLKLQKVDLAIGVERTTYHDFIMSEALIRDRHVVYYDASQRSAPETKSDYAQGPHVGVDFGKQQQSLVDIAFAHNRLTREVAVNVPSYSLLPDMIDGTDLIATMPMRYHSTLFNGLAYCEPPVPIPSFNYTAYWHQNSHNTQRNIWLRGVVRSVYDGLEQIAA